ncbi:MAG: hypothetical protein M0R40_09770 [Firmicutes bacterium]|nr:hypothetical protein [Bacillota bacterium]
MFLNEYDTIIDAPIPPAGWSGITSANDSIYGYFGNPPMWQVFGGGGGGAGLTTADNGLTVNPAGNVRLGGTMLDNSTQLSFDNNSSLEFLYPNGQGTVFSNDVFGTAINNGGFDYFIAIDPTGSSGFGTGVTAGITNGATLELLPTSGTLNAGSSSGNQSKSVFTPTSLQLTVTDNLSFSNAITLTPTLFSAQIPTGGFDVGTTAATMQNGNSTNAVNFYALGTLERFRFAAEGSSAGSDLFLNLANPNLVQFQSQDDQIQIGTLGTTYTIDESAETAVLSSSAGSTLTTNVSALDEVDLLFNTNATVQAGDNRFFANWTDGANTTGFVNISATLTQLDHSISGTGNARLNLNGAGNNATFSSGTTGSGATIDMSIVGTTLLTSTQNLVVFPVAVDSDVAIQTQDGATVAQNSGNILLRTGSVTSGTGAVGDIEIRLGVQGGSGSGGSIQIDATSGELIFTITRTDCTGAPSGAIANVAGVLNICP